jgi:hypothetical protein
MIKREKWFEIDESIFITCLNIFNSNMFLTLKIMNFENVSLTPKKSFYVIKNMYA